MMRNNRNRETTKPNTILAIPSLQQTPCMFPLAEALGKCRCPCLLGSLAPDVSRDDNEGAILLVRDGGWEKNKGHELKQA